MIRLDGRWPQLTAAGVTTAPRIVDVTLWRIITRGISRASPYFLNNTAEPSVAKKGINFGVRSLSIARQKHAATTIDCWAAERPLLNRRGGDRFGGVERAADFLLG